MAKLKVGNVKFKSSQGLGAGLGLGPNNRADLLNAVASGTLDQYLADKPGLRAMFEQKVTKQPANRKEAKQAQKAYVLWGAGKGTLGGTSALSPGVDISSPPPEVPAAPTGAPMTPEEMIKQAGGGVGATAQGLTDYLKNQLNVLGSAPAQPNFQEMMDRWLKVSNREADRQAAQITETMGARGARYGSDLPRMTADYRAEFLDRIMSKADEVSRGLRQDRTAEQQALLAPYVSAASLEEQARQNALQRLFADSLATRGLPPAVLEAIKATAGLTPDTIVSGG